MCDVVSMSLYRVAGGSSLDEVPAELNYTCQLPDICEMLQVWRVDVFLLCPDTFFGCSKLSHVYANVGYVRTNYDK